MAHATVTGYKLLSIDAKGAQTLLPRPPATFKERVEITSTAQHSSAIPDDVTMLRIRVPTAAPCHVNIGVDAVATNVDPAMSGGATEYFAAVEDKGMRVSLLETATADE